MFISHSSSLILLITGACVFGACAVIAALSRHKKSAQGELELQGRVAMVVEALEPEGAVLVDGELWRARACQGVRIARGQVRVVGARGHWLEVEPVR
ncbi:MAG: NfeD family protein [Pyrinomonadaceae bacterium]